MSAPPELAADLTALRTAAAVASPGLRSAVSVSGPDHRDWLDRLTSMPVRDLPAGHCTWTTLLDAKGRLRADLRVLNAGADDALLLDVPASHHAALLRVLDMYILREKVQVTDLASSHRFVSVLGPRAGAALKAVGLPHPAAGRVESAPDVLAAAPSRLFGAAGTDLIVASSAADALVERLQAAGARRVGRDALDVQRIGQGVAWFAEDLADGVIPLEAGLDADVSVTKGCYPGQEVVARIHNLGQVARRMVRLAVDGEHEVARGALLTGTGERAGQEAGRITSAAHDPLLQRTVALAFVRRAFWTAGSRLATGDVEFTVAELPAR